jgi:hypothetical protein
MKNKDVYDILKSLDEEPEHNSHEGFNRSNYLLNLTFIYII